MDKKNYVRLTHYLYRSITELYRLVQLILKLHFFITWNTFWIFSKANTLLNKISISVTNITSVPKLMCPEILFLMILKAGYTNFMCKHRFTQTAFSLGHLTSFDFSLFIRSCYPSHSDWSFIFFFRIFCRYLQYGSHCLKRFENTGHS